MNELKCPICQGMAFKNGTLKGKYDVKVVEEDAGFVEKNTIFGGELINVKICTNCRYMMLFG